MFYGKSVAEKVELSVRIRTPPINTAIEAQGSRRAPKNPNYE